MSGGHDSPHYSPEESAVDTRQQEIEVYVRENTKKIESAASLREVYDIMIGLDPQNIMPELAPKFNLAGDFQGDDVTVGNPIKMLFTLLTVMDYPGDYEQSKYQNPIYSAGRKRAMELYSQEIVRMTGEMEGLGDLSHLFYWVQEHHFLRMEADRGKFLSSRKDGGGNRLIIDTPEQQYELITNIHEAEPTDPDDLERRLPKEAASVVGEYIGLVRRIKEKAAELYNTADGKLRMAA